MCSGFVSLWLLAALGQTSGAAADAAWLKQVPANADVVIRIRGVEPVRNDLSKMVQAMSPALANQLTPALEQGIQQMVSELGKDALATDAPILAMIRLPKPGELGTKKGPPFVTFAHTKDYPAFQKAIARGGDPQSKHQSGGYDTVKDNEGNPLYTIKGDGYAAMSNDEELMQSIAKPKDTLDKALNASLKTSLFTGDVGLYVNLAAIQKLYGDQIDAARQQFMAALDAMAQGGASDMMKVAKSMYGTMFDALKDAEALVLNFDFSGAGLTLGGEVTTKPGSETFKFLAGPQTSAAQELAKLPDDLSTYFFFNASPSSMERLQTWGMYFMTGPDEKPSPELQKALELQREAGVKDISVSSGIGPDGVRGISLATYTDPQKAVAAATAMLQATKTSKSPLAAMFKDITIEPKAETYRGFVFNHTRMSIDVVKLGQLTPNVGNTANMMKAMFGDSFNHWYGTDGKQFISVVAADWQKAKALIDTLQTGQGNLAKLKSYQTLRSKLPAQVNGLVLMSAQGVVRQFTTQISAMMPDNPALKLPGDMPKDTVLFGGSIVTAPGSVQFQFIVPSGVGEVFEKGLVPLIQGIAGKANQ